MILKHSATLLMLAASPVAADCQPGALRGEVTYVRDGDTIELGAMAIRLNGLAAPEGDGPAATKPRKQCEPWCLARWLHASWMGDRNHDRCIAVCTLDGADIAAALVSEVLARDCPRF